MNQKETEQVEEEMKMNNRAFILMAGYRRANLFRDLNKRYNKLL